MLAQLEKTDPLLDIARELRDGRARGRLLRRPQALPQRRLLLGILLRAIGIPLEMFTVMFAIGRMPGWIANWKEINEDPKGRIYRPRQVYVGPTDVKWRPRDER
ncbi:MAG: citrate/2-methylcitrate synthase [Micropruina glycogenica]